MFSRLASLGCAVALTVAAGGCSNKTATATPPASGGQSVSTTPSAAPGPAQAGPNTPAQQTTGADATNATPCTARELTLMPGTGNGDFNGMSHSGTYLVLTNRSRTACSIPGLPQLTFLDANGPVQTEADLPGAKFMHPGPQVLPIVLQPKQSITTSARWVSGSVFQDNLCYKLTGVTLALREGAAHMALVGQMCGERSKGVHYDLQRYGANTAQ